MVLKKEPQHCGSFSLLLPPYIVNYINVKRAASITQSDHHDLQRYAKGVTPITDLKAAENLL